MLTKECTCHITCIQARTEVQQLLDISTVIIKEHVHVHGFNMYDFVQVVKLQYASGIHGNWAKYVCVEKKQHLVMNQFSCVSADFRFYPGPRIFSEFFFFFF